MGVSDGQNVDAAITNAAFMDKNEDTFTVGEVSLQNPVPASGANVDNVQKELNSESSYTGKPLNSDADALPTWIDSTVGTASDNLQERSDALTTATSTNTSNIATNTSDIADNTADISDTKTAVGIAAGETDMGTYPGDIISDNVDQVTIHTELETAIEAIPSGLVFKGNWDADTNSPTLADGGVGGVEGDYYIVSVAGTTSIDGITDWGVGDWIVNVDTKWDKIDNSETVTSVNGETGTVVLDTDDISEGVTNEYYTNAKADARIALASIDDLSDVDTTTSAPSVDDVLKWDGSDWVPGVGGGGGQGGINYLTGDDTNFEGGTVGTWVQYNDGSVAEPVDGTGGVASGNVTWVATNSDLLRGDWLGNFNAIATNNQGEGISVDFTIDKADWNKSLYLSYDVYTGGNWAADHVLPFIYDVDAATLVPLSRSGASDRFTGRFSTNGTSLNYRLILHIASSDTRNFTHAIDNVQIGPDKILDAPVVVNYDESVVSPTSIVYGTEVSNFDNLRLSGTRTGGVYSLDIRFQFDLAAGNNFDALTIDLKNNFSFLSGKTITRLGGSWASNVNSSTAGRGYVFGQLELTGGNLMQVTFCGDFLAQTNRSGAGTLLIYVEDEANQSALISTTETLNETVLVDTLTFRTPTGTISAAWNKTQFSAADIENDELGLFNDSTDQIKIPETGRYSLPALIQFNGTPAGDSFVRIYNVTQSKVLDIGQVAGVTGASVNMSAQTTGKTWVANKNDLIEIQTFSFLTTPTYAASATGSHFSLISHNQLSVYGLYGETEYKDVELASLYNVVADDTWESVTGMSLSLTAGEWAVGYNAVATWVWTSGTFSPRTNFAVYDVTGLSRLDDTITISGAGNLTSTAQNQSRSVSSSSNIVLSEDTTIRLEARSSGTSNGTTTVHADSVTGQLTNPDGASVLWARRIK